MSRLQTFFATTPIQIATLAQAGQTAAQKAKKSAEAAWEKWSQETANKHPELASSICQPNFDVSFFTSKQGRQFPCKVENVVASPE